MRVPSSVLLFVILCGVQQQTNAYGAGRTGHNHRAVKRPSTIGSSFGREEAPLLSHSASFDGVHTSDSGVHRESGLIHDNNSGFGQGHHIDIGHAGTGGVQGNQGFGGPNPSLSSFEFNQGHVGSEVVTVNHEGTFPGVGSQIGVPRFGQQSGHGKGQIGSIGNDKGPIGPIDHGKGPIVNDKGPISPISHDKGPIKPTGYGKGPNKPIVYGKGPIAPIATSFGVHHVESVHPSSQQSFVSPPDIAAFNPVVHNDKPLDSSLSQFGGSSFDLASTSSIHKTNPAKPQLPIGVASTLSGTSHGVAINFDGAEISGPGHKQRFGQDDHYHGVGDHHQHGGDHHQHGDDHHHQHGDDHHHHGGDHHHHLDRDGYSGREGDSSKRRVNTHNAARPYGR